MILVDSTIWIEFLRSNPDYIKEMEGLMEAREIIIIEPVFAELLYGCRSEKDKNKILAYWKVLPRLDFSQGSVIEAAEYANKNSFHNLGIGLIDTILIKATVENKCLVWTLDKKILNNLDKQFIYKS
ncbi:MAG TPA: PIN domain-containing protein [Bacteroidales bacterium]